MNTRVLAASIVTLSTLACIGAGSPVSGALYECMESSGTIYTDAPVQLQNCRDMRWGAAPVAEQHADGFMEPRIVEAPLVRRSPPVIVSLHRSGALFVVQVRLNDRREARLIVDTGASHTILSRAAARDAGILTAHDDRTITLKTAGGQVQGALAQVPSLQVGKAEVRDVAVAIYDLPDVPVGIDGLLGLTFLQHFLVTLDTRNNTLSLQPRS